MNNTKPSASSVVISSIFMINLGNGAQFLNPIQCTLSSITAILPVTKM